MKFHLVLFVIIAAIFGVGLEGCQCKVVQFIFGDSLSDVGNNNYLSKSLAQASLPWYGIDLGNGLPNGRFSNGRTVADIIGNCKSFTFMVKPQISPRNFTFFTTFTKCHSCLSFHCTKVNSVL